jgi:PAS domain S-box-containing protein
VDNYLTITNDLFQALSDAANDAIIVINAEGKIVFWNSAAESMFGYSRDEVKNQNLHKFLAPDYYKDSYIKGFNLFQTTGKGEVLGKTLELTALRKNQQEIIVELSVSAINIKEQWHALGIIRDITKRKQTEEELRQYRDQLEKIYEGIIDGLAIADIETLQYLSVNKSMCKMFGYTEDELLSMTVKDTHLPEHHERVLTEFKEKIKGERIFSEDIPCLRKDGSIFYADICDSKILYNGRTCMIAFFRDTSERKKYEEEIKNKNQILAEKSNKLEELINVKNEFLGMVSHDLRNPLNSIYLTSSSLLIAQNDNFTEEAVDMLWLIKTCSRRLLLMVNDLLDLAAINSGKIQLNKQKVEIREILNPENLLFQFEKDKSSCLNITIEKNLPLLNIDINRIHQVLENIILNAIHFSKPGSPINITASRENEYINISIEDKGMGIPEEEIKQIFKPFVMASTKQDSKVKSTGLGLAIAKKIIELHGGSINVESKIGEGSNFSILLPIKNDH